jgi:23S rRNA (guanosine2251-2'-O)-methyltransferase
MLAGERRVQVRRVPRREIEQMARSEAPQGIIARAAALEDVVLDDVLAKRNDKKLFLVAVDGVTDPGNLGAILRSCDGAGVDAVVLPRHRAVHVTPTVAKSAAGAIEYVPMCVVPGLPSAIQSLRDAGVWVVGLDDEAHKSLFDLASRARTMRSRRVDSDGGIVVVTQRVGRRRVGDVRGGSRATHPLVE